MLHCVTTLMGSYRSGCHTARLVHRAAEIDRMIGGVVMVGQTAFDAGNLYIVDAVSMEHLLGHIATCHATAEGLFRKLLELAIQVGLHDIAHQGDTDEDYPD
jgi:hypothetical protein